MAARHGTSPSAHAARAASIGKEVRAAWTSLAHCAWTGLARCAWTGLACAVALGTLASCGVISRHKTPAVTASQPIPVGSSTETITVDGLARTFHLYRPAGIDTPAPLVVMLHGGFGSGSQAERSYGWDAEAGTGHFIVAYPDGLHHAWNTDGGGCCGKPASEHIDDVAFITAMVAAIERGAKIDVHRIYATGISNGGILAYTLACKTHIFAAIAPDSATELAACPSPAPLSVIHVHGTADTRIPYAGGEGSGPAHINGPSIPAVNEAWRAIDRCAAPSISISGVVTTSVATCPHGIAVELITVAGAGHQWPGAVSRPVIERLLGLDPPSTALDATQVIWSFFAAHPMPSGPP